VSAQRFVGEVCASQPGLAINRLMAQLSGLILVSLTTLCHFAIFRLRTSRKSSGEPSAGSMP
jgi:hypothetical protein